MTSKSKFQRGGRGVFTCDLCSRSTREVDQGNSGLCPQCFEIAGYDNQVNDDGLDVPPPAILAECNRLLEEAVKKGGSESRIKKNNTFIWPAPKQEDLPEIISGDPDLDRY